MPPQRHPSTGAIRTTQMFRRSPELPIELQVQIWLYAAGLISFEDDYLIDLDSNMPACYFPPNIIVHNPATHVYAPRDEVTVQLRNSLTAACRLSRLMALSAWKSDISKILIKALPATPATWAHAMRGRKMKVVDELIAMIKGYMEGREVEVV